MLRDPTFGFLRSGFAFCVFAHAFRAFTRGCAPSTAAVLAALPIPLACFFAAQRQAAAFAVE
jgi:hypothetical protein